MDPVDRLIGYVDGDTEKLKRAMFLIAPYMVGDLGMMATMVMVVEQFVFYMSALEALKLAKPDCSEDYGRYNDAINRIKSCNASTVISANAVLERIIGILELYGEKL